MSIRRRGAVAPPVVGSLSQRFASLFRDDGKSVQLTASELALFIEGCDLVGRHTLSPGIVKPKPLVLDRAV